MDYLTLFNKRKSFLWLLFLLVLVNCLAIFLLDVVQSRYVRLLSTVVFFGAYLILGKTRNIYILAALVFFLLKDIFIQGYEEILGYSLYLIFGILAYATLISERLPRLREIKFNATIVIVSVGLIIANTYTLHVILDMIGHSFDNFFQVFLFFMYGAFMMLLAVSAVSYNNQVNSNRSLLFTFLVFAFLTSDISALFAYYFDVTFCFYVDRVAYLLGFSFMINYGLNFKVIQEEEEQLKLISSDNDTARPSGLSETDDENISSADQKASLYTFVEQANQSGLET